MWIRCRSHWVGISLCIWWWLYIRLYISLVKWVCNHVHIINVYVYCEHI
jgi:hypothetical protein